MKTMPMIDQNLTEAPVATSTTSLAPHAENDPIPRPSGRPRVVVVGAGFGGLHVAAKLAHANVDVLVLDRNNYHGFWPLLYQVATAGLDPASIAYPARAILRKYPNTQFLMAEVSGVDFERKLVLSGDKALPYDYLVLAAGSANNYFGDTVLAAHTFGMKDLDEAEQLRNQLLRAFERAVVEPDPVRRAALLTLVIIGGGPTGVELSGAFAELIRHVLRKDYPMLDIAQARVLLVEASDRILASFPEHLQHSARKRLEKMGVEIKLGTAVAAVDGDTVTFKDGTQINSSTVVWAAGVRAAELVDALGLAVGRSARVKITPKLNLPDHPEVFVIGDMAYLEGYKGTQAYPMVAQVAMQMGKQAARNILALIEDRPLGTFHYRDKGQMATIGRRAAVFDAFGIRLSGFFAWIGWLFIHIIYLIGFRNRLVVLTNWAYNYFTYDRAVRLITGQERKEA
jgi:NADH:ubiquinone reductase (H+-translocating)